MISPLPKNPAFMVFDWRSATARTILLTSIFRSQIRPSNPMVKIFYKRSATCESFEVDCEISLHCCLEKYGVQLLTKVFRNNITDRQTSIVNCSQQDRLVATIRASIEF